MRSVRFFCSAWLSVVIFAVLAATIQSYTSIDCGRRAGCDGWVSLIFITSIGVGLIHAICSMGSLSISDKYFPVAAGKLLYCTQWLFSVVALSVLYLSFQSALEIALIFVSFCLYSMLAGMAYLFVVSKIQRRI
ncbi:hypothetical protein [Pelagibaculum spongiae]|uniref:Uncharacterized protein n=1 Tax=Pelagibaculum spongiae TaxID=2080658 RepID=A0A2V1H0H9_9GAMM|nr:hypothetical protein [Pelagibaculum spongiae]PVZ69573.1 hypothetical protein DC094_09660 [Pelagibaculum spongiae]